MTNLKKIKKTTAIFVEIVHKFVILFSSEIFHGLRRLYTKPNWSLKIFNWLIKIDKFAKWQELSENLKKKSHFTEISKFVILKCWRLFHCHYKICSNIWYYQTAEVTWALRQKRKKRNFSEKGANFFKKLEKIVVLKYWTFSMPIENRQNGTNKT